MSISATELIKKQISQMGIPEPTLEHKFISKKKWAFDFSWPDLKLAFEVEGGAFINGRHTRGKGFSGDIEKYNEAAMLGWTLIRATSQQVKSGKAIEWLLRAHSNNEN